MKQFQEDALGMLIAIKDVMNANSTIWRSNTVVANAVGTLASDIRAIGLTAANQRTNRQGATATKNQVKVALIADAVALALAGKAYAVFVNDATLKAACSITETRLIKTTEESLVGVCQTLYDDVNPYISSMGGYGVSPATQVGLQNNITNFSNLIGTPRAVQAVGVAATRLLDEQLRVAIAFVEEQLDALMNQYKVSDEAFYKAYHAARKRVHRGHRTKVMVVGNVTNAGVPVANAIVSCTVGTHPKKIHKKKTKIDGKFKFFLPPPVDTMLVAELRGFANETKNITSKVAQTMVVNFAF
ncbi:MAG: hypothetical protein ACYDCN_10995 [Bacteroidia bacterium]